MSSVHKGGANVCFADVSVRFLPETLSRQQLEALLTIATGESIDPNAF
ncbi:MAG: H-X9-DG-CTERM domain-containing protein [Planctomycetota bacterium]